MGIPPHPSFRAYTSESVAESSTGAGQGAKTSASLPQLRRFPPAQSTPAHTRLTLSSGPAHPLRVFLYFLTRFTTCSPVLSPAPAPLPYKPIMPLQCLLPHLTNLVNSTRLSPRHPFWSVRVPLKLEHSHVRSPSAV